MSKKCWGRRTEDGQPVPCRNFRNGIAVAMTRRGLLGMVLGALGALACAPVSQVVKYVSPRQPTVADLFVTYGAEVSGEPRSRCLCCTSGLGSVVRDDLCDVHRAYFDKHMERFALAVGLPVDRAAAMVGSTIVQLGAGRDLSKAVTAPIVGAGATIVSFGMSFEEAFTDVRISSNSHEGENRVIVNDQEPGAQYGRDARRGHTQRHPVLAGPEWAHLSTRRRRGRSATR